jgi:hypothetical protein
MKKNKINLIIWVLLSSIILVATTFITINLLVPFSFDGLTTNIIGAKAIGIGQVTSNNILSRRSITLNGVNNFNTYDRSLIMIDSNDNVVPIKFYNQNNQTVKIPYAVQAYETHGEFTYILFVKEALFNKSELYSPLIFDDTYNGSGSPRLELITPFTQNLMEIGINIQYDKQRLIAIHHLSGKVFDFKSIFEQYYWITIGPGNINHLIHLNNGFILQGFKTEPNRSNQSSCHAVFKFDNDSEGLIATEFCSEVTYNLIFVKDNFDFFYSSYSGETFLYDFQNNTSRSISIAYPPMVQFNDKFYSHYGLSTYDLDFNIIGNNNIDNFNMNNLLHYRKIDQNYVYIHRNNIYIFNPDSPNLFNESFPSEIKASFIYGTDTYFLNDLKIWKLNIYTKEMYTIGEITPEIDEAITNYGYKNILFNAVQYGWIFYSEMEGLNLFERAYNIYTGEITQVSEAKPTIQVSFISPINR